ncbi:MAG: hypothetical protein FJX53_04515 [Alphaproteobacteria bacterium]|nr:hypothetical protein [Alphaproteobacteria bacterium]
MTNLPSPTPLPGTRPIEIPDYFHWAQILNGGKDTEFLKTCTGIAFYGPDMIAGEPELFAVAQRIRDEHQGAFRSGAR